MLDVIGIGFIILAISIVLIGRILVRQNENTPSERKKKNYKFAILIPARDESKVIEGLLRSIKLQTYPIDMKDVYVVVEEKQDKSVFIAKRFGARVFVRKHLDLRRKGYALDEVVRDILNHKKHYDAYFVIDADNILDPNFLSKMSESYQQGYDIAIGYRNCKNGNDSLIAACSTLTFSLINTQGNLKKNTQTRNVIISGTGFFVDGSLVEKWGGWPFHSLTEDYELSMYAIVHNLTTYYNDEAIFYDEQPIFYKQTIPQRIRWIRGFLDTRRIYEKEIYKKVRKKNPNWGSQIGEMIGITPYVLILVGVALLIFSSLFQFGYSLVMLEQLDWQHLGRIGFIIGASYLVMAVITYRMIKIESQKINLSKRMRIKAILFHPLFFATYIPCFFRAIFKKEITWEPVEHTRKEIVKN